MRATLLVLLAITVLLAVALFITRDVEEDATAPPAPARRDLLAIAEDTRIELSRGTATLHCVIGTGAAQDAGSSIDGLTLSALRERVRGCAPAQLLRLVYAGGIDAQATRLIAAVTLVANQTGIRGRVLEADSRGGDIVAAMEAGDLMGEHDWAMWLPRDADCHSACTMLLAAARYRAVFGDVGIHRVFPGHSEARSRAELALDLERILERVRSYLLRHGVSTQLADAMMAVPAREIRVLSASELESYGLVGPNAAQADLERIQLTQRCGIDFARRADAWMQAHATECIAPWVQRAREEGVSPRRVECDVLACGLALESQYGFPDAACPDLRPIQWTSSWHFCEQAAGPAPAAP